jgi:glycosyltransferase involved in cell wall biosynthesis
LHTGSEFVAGEIEEIFGPGLRAAARVVVIPLGVPPLGDDAVMPPDVAPAVGDAPFVVAIGTLEPRKNFGHLVGAFGTLAAGDADVRLVIAGNDGPARPEIDAAIERLAPDARDRVVLAGPVTDAGRRALLEHATVLAYPSIYEGFGFPVLEAMTAGVPVVAARAGSIPEVADDAAILVEPTNEEMLAAALHRVMTDDATRAELIARGRDRVHAFSWRNTARALASCYRNLVEHT